VGYIGEKPEGIFDETKRLFLKGESYMLQLKNQ